MTKNSISKFQAKSSTKCMVKYKEIKRRNTEIRYQDIKNLDIPSEYSRIRPEIKNNMNKKNVKKKDETSPTSSNCGR